MMYRDAEVVVIGGGPAGAAAARFLGLRGRKVIHIPAPPPRHPPLAESLPPSIRKLLSEIQLLQDVEEGGFVRSGGNAVAWGGSTLEPRPFPDGGTGFQVLRDRLDRLFLEGARAAGVEVLPGAAAREVLETPGEAGCVPPLREVRWESPEGGGTLRTRWVLDASGRAGVTARRGLRRRQDGPATTAILGVWRGPGAEWGLPDDSFTLVESYADGWGWSVPVAPGLRYVAAMVDPRVTRSTAPGSALAQRYRGELEKTRHLKALLASARLQGSPWACSATPYHAGRYALPGLLLVGDAGSFLDPLSSFGVKKALASGWLAAVTVHTVLDSYCMLEPALELFQRREEEAHAGYMARAAGHYAIAARHHLHPFWTARSEGHRAAPGSAPEIPDELVAHPRVAAALRTLRGAEEIQLRSSPRLRRIALPTVRGDRVVLEEHLASPALPAGIRYLRGVELPELLDLAEHHRGVPELFEAYSRSRRPVRLPDFLGALSALVGFEMLETGAHHRHATPVEM